MAEPSPDTRFYSFLASPYAGSEQQGLRRDIAKLGRDFGLPIWVAEVERPDLAPASGVDQLEVVDACMAAIAQARSLIAVVDGSMGTHLDPHGHGLVASHIEMELFQAAFLGKRVHVFGIGRIDDQSPAGRLLKILQFAYSGTTRTNVDGPQEVLSEIRRLLLAEKGRWLPRLELRRGQMLVGALGTSRHVDWTNERLWQELRFLDGALAVGSRSPADRVLGNVEKGRDGRGIGARRCVRSCRHRAGRRPPVGTARRRVSPGRRDGRGTGGHALSLMRTGHGPGFVVRGKKKLALGLATRLDLRGTFAELMEARDIAKDHQLEGQLDVTLRVGARFGDFLQDLGLPIARRQDG